MTLPGSCLLRRMLPKLMLPMFYPGSISGTTCAYFTGLSTHLLENYKEAPGHWCGANNPAVPGRGGLHH